MKILHRWNETILYEDDKPTLRESCEEASRKLINLGEANLGEANLGEANLGEANLREANLGEANLGEANLKHVRVDYFDVLLRASTNGEVPGLIAALKAGEVDGSTYTGDCCCLVGTLAKLKKLNYQAIPDLAPDSSRPIECFFTAIKKGDTPATNQVGALVLTWAEDFQRLMQRAKHVG